MAAFFQQLDMARIILRQCEAEPILQHRATTTSTAIATGVTRPYFLSPFESVMGFLFYEFLAKAPIALLYTCIRGWSGVRAVDTVVESTTIKEG